jgi:cytochrome c oxidase subunit 2
MKFLGFQDAASPLMEGIIDLHNSIMFYLVLIIVFVFWMMGLIIYNFYYETHNPHNSTSLNQSRILLLKTNKVVHGTLLEIVWTLTPTFILLFIAIPSFALLYAMDEIIEPAITLKVVGHQWYWSYEYSDYVELNQDSALNPIAFDSYMVSDDDLNYGDLRLLEVDNKIVLPIDTNIRVLITSADVLHSWAVPSLGVKMDAVPGRLNQISLFIKREGVYYGQCSELCGVNHAFMPIAIKAVSVNEYVEWVKAKIVAANN